MVWECQACNYVYDSRRGDPDSGVQAGTRFEELNENWKCPVCGVGKEFFEEVSKTDD